MTAGAGWGYVAGSGEKHAFLMRGVPEPATLALLAAGGAGVWMRRKAKATPRGISGHRLQERNSR
jgi:hypothetical protein